jgi:hypothetical protein
VPPLSGFNSFATYIAAIQARLRMAGAGGTPIEQAIQRFSAMCEEVGCLFDATSTACVADSALPDPHLLFRQLCLAYLVWKLGKEVLRAALLAGLACGLDVPQLAMDFAGRSFLSPLLYLVRPSTFVDGLVLPGLTTQQFASMALFDAGSDIAMGSLPELAISLWFCQYVQQTGLSTLEILAVCSTIGMTIYHTSLLLLKLYRSLSSQSQKPTARDAPRVDEAASASWRAADLPVAPSPRRASFGWAHTSRPRNLSTDSELVLRRSLLQDALLPSSCVEPEPCAAPAASSSRARPEYAHCS